MTNITGNTPAEIVSNLSIDETWIRYIFNTHNSIIVSFQSIIMTLILIQKHLR
jgi:hypothetical protein